ncbi:hypothetical protein TKK_0012969 [Trichogramma kaykai]
MALQRFASRRGFPRKLYSDNGTNFRGADVELRNAIKNLDKDALKDFVLSENFEWFFNPPAAPFMGGSWKRLINARDSEALMPNHFLIERSSKMIRFTRFEKAKLCLRKQWQLAQQFADACWSPWLKSYLPTLVPRKKWFSSDIALKTGDLVLILDDSAPKNLWRKGVIIKTFPEPDGEICSAEVKTYTRILVRPTRKLVKFAEVQNA